MICSATTCDLLHVSEEIDLESDGGRLKWARIRAGYDSATEFAKACGVNPTTYRAYENSQNGYGKMAASFARKAHVPVEWLLEGGDPPTGDAPAKPRLTDTIDKAPDRAPTRDASEGETVSITSLDLSYSMGPGTDIDGYIEENPIEMDIGWLRRITRSEFARLRIARGVGDSMYPTLLTSDVVLIDTTQNTLSQQDRVYAISLYGASAIKRLRRIGDGKVLVKSDNPTVDDQEVDSADIKIDGRVIWFGRDL